jgi:hypothetical protein
MVYEAFQAKTFFLVLAGLCIALSALGFLAAGVIPTASTTNHGAYPVTGWIIVACCFVMAGVFVKRALDRTPQLRIGPDGIWYRLYSDATIPWDQFVSCQVMRIYNQRVVQLNLRDPAAWPSTNRFTRATAGMNSAMGFNGVGIAATNLSGGPEQVLQAIARYRPDLFPR